MDYILIIFSAWICVEVIFLICYVYILHETPNFSKAVKLFPVPQKILTDKIRPNPSSTCCVRDHSGTQKFGQRFRYIFKTTNDGILIRDCVPQHFFFPPLRLLARTIFLPWNSLSAPEPEKSPIFGAIKNRVKMSVDGSPIIISINRKDLFG